MALTPEMVLAATQAYADEDAFACEASTRNGTDYRLRFYAGGVKLVDQTVTYVAGVEPWLDDLSLWKDAVAATGRSFSAQEQQRITRTKARIQAIRTRLREIRTRLIELQGNGGARGEVERIRLVTERRSLAAERAELRSTLRVVRERPRFHDKSKRRPAKPRPAKARKPKRPPQKETP